MTEFQAFQEHVRKQLAEAIGLSPERLFGAKTIPLTYNERDLDKFYARHNAMLKGFRRRSRQFKSRLSKLAHKKH